MLCYIVIVYNNSQSMKVSIITIAYNSMETIRDTFRSVLEQSYDEIEYLVIDGGSDDGTLSVIKEYEPLFGARLKWISEKDNGIYDAMNKGIKMASGEIVGILNSDDYFTQKDIIAKVVLSFESHADLDAVYGDIHFINHHNPEKCIRYYSSRLFRPFWLRFGFMPAHPSFYCRKEIFAQAGLYKTDYKIGADYEMMVRLFIKHKIRAKYIPLDFVTMRTGGVSTRNAKSKLILIKEDVRACRENGVYTTPIFICMKYLYKIFELRMPF